MMIAENLVFLFCDILISPMHSNQFADTSYRLNPLRIIRWLTVALYTAALPYVILVFLAMQRHLPANFAVNTPLFIIILLALAYMFMGIKGKMVVHCAIVLAISTVIVILIMTFENNTNKYIHIPEYVLMSWILYQALVADYKGGGILLLVFICGAMLGVVDEIMQGIHPQRTYGWKDMVIDSASSLIGILSLTGLKRPEMRKWGWHNELRYFTGSLAVVLFGAVSAVPMCSYLFEVHNQRTFFNIYPGWLLTCNGVFLGAGVAVIVFHWPSRQKSDPVKHEIKSIRSYNHATALLWVICPLTILISMHALVVWVAVAGINFR
jgi:VanZ family protein